jgi:hypothetical protein
VANQLQWSQGARHVMDKTGLEDRTRLTASINFDQTEPKTKVPKEHRL